MNDIKQNEDNFLTILIPTYNSSKFILRTWKSVQKQTDKSFKIIFRDDCSSDNTVEILNKIAENDSRVKVIAGTTNIGLGEQRNELIKMVRSKYFMFLDDDDILYKNAVKVMKEKAIKSNSDIIGGKTKIGYFLNNNLISMPNLYRKIKKEMTPIDYYANNIVFCWGILINTEFYRSLNFEIATRIYEDVHFLAVVFCNAKTMSVCNVNTVCYIKRKNSISAFNNEKVIERLDILYEQYIKTYKTYSEKVTGDEYAMLVDEKTFAYALVYQMFLQNANKQATKTIVEHFKQNVVPLLIKYKFKFKKPLRFWKLLVSMNYFIYSELKKVNKINQ